MTNLVTQTQQLQNATQDVWRTKHNIVANKIIRHKRKKLANTTMTNLGYVNTKDSKDDMSRIGCNVEFNREGPAEHTKERNGNQPYTRATYEREHANK